MSDDALFPIRMAAKFTGLSTETLRMWELRYGFPAPAREGRARIYTMTEIETLRLCKRAIDSGFRPKDVVGRPSAELEDLLHAARAAVQPHEAALGIDQRSLIAKLQADDLAGLRTDLRTAAMNLGPRDFVRELAQPLVATIGELWSAGALEVRHEHLMSELLKTQLRLLMSEYEYMSHAPRVLLTTLPGEVHMLGLEMVALFLITCGATPLLLGIETPIDQIARAAEALRADAVGLTVTPIVDARLVSRQVDQLAKTLPNNMAIWVGGSGARALQYKNRTVLKLGAWDDIALAVRKLRVTIRDA